jgi:hypothetical protein
MMNKKSDKELKQLIDNIRNTFPDVENYEISNPTRELRAREEGFRLLFLQTDERVQKNMREIVENFKTQIVPEQIDQIKKYLLVQEKLYHNIEDMPASAEKVQAFTMLASVNHQSEKILQISRSVVDRNSAYLSKKEQKSINEQYHVLNEEISNMKEKLAELRTQILAEDVSNPDKNTNTNSNTDSDENAHSGASKPKMK